MRIPSGVTDQYVYFVAVDATDFTSRETGLTSFTVYRSRNGGAAAAMTTPTINETDSANMPGVYELLLDEDMTIDAGDDVQEMCFHITHAGMAPITRTIELYRPKITAGNTLGVASDGDVSGNVDGTVATVTTVTNDVGVNEWNGVALSTTNPLPNAAAGAAGGLPTDSAGKTSFNDLSAAAVNTEVDNSMVTYGLDHLISAAVTGTDVTDNSICAKLVSASATADWDDFVNTTDALQAIVDRGNSAWTTATNAGVSMVLPAGDLGDRTEDSTIEFMFMTVDNTGAPSTMTGGTLSAYKTNNVTQTTTGFTLTQDFDTVTGLNHVTLATTDAFYVASEEYTIVLTGGTVNGDTVSGVVATFSVANRYMRGTDSAALASDYTSARAGYLDNINGHTAQTGDNYARLGAPVGASISADIATVDANVDAILVDTGTTLDTKLNDIQGATFDSGTDSLESIRNRGDLAWTTGSGTGLTALASGTAQGGTASTIQLAAGESFGDDILNGAVVNLTGGTGAGQTRVITDYTGATDTATVSPNWTTNPSTDTTYEVVHGSVNIAAVSNVAEDLPTATDLATVDTNVDAILVDTNSLNDIKVPQTLNLTASGNIGIDWANVENPTTAVDLSATDIQLCDTVTTNTDMRGTDNAALASAWTATRAGYVDNLNGHTAQTGDTFAQLPTNFSSMAINSTGHVSTMENMQSTTIATLSSQTSFTLAAGSTDNDAYNDALIIVTDSVTAAQKAVGYISDYVGATKTVTLAADPGIFTMAVGDLVDIFVMRGTDSAALASAYTATRAGYLDNLNGHTAQTGDVFAALPTNFSDLSITASTGRVDIGSWLGTAVTLSATTAKPEVDVNSISDDATAANNLELDYDGTGYAKANSTIGTCTTNTDMITAATIWTTALTESYAADGAAFTGAQALYALVQYHYDRDVSGTAMTVRKLDGATAAAVITLDSGTTPTDINRTS